MGRGSIPRETIVCIERILLDESDVDESDEKHKYLTISKIRKLLADLYEIEVSKETVSDCLETLAKETLNSPKNITDGTNSPLVPPYKLISRAGKKPNSPKEYAVSRSYPIAQIKHLIRHLRDDDTGVESLEAEHLLFKLIDKKAREELDDDLYNSDPLADGTAQEENDKMLTTADGLKQLLEKVEKLDKAIRKMVKVKFRTISETDSGQVKSRPRAWVPYLIAPSDGYYYLFVRPQGNNSTYDVMPFRVDTLTDLQVTCTSVGDPKAYAKGQETAKSIFRAGIGRWFSRSTADIESVVVAFSQVACENEKKQRYLFEAMKGKKGFEPVGETIDGRPQFRFDASRQAMEMWAFKMSDLFELVSPQPWRETVIRMIAERATDSVYGNVIQKELEND